MVQVFGMKDRTLSFKNLSVPSIIFQGAFYVGGHEGCFSGGFEEGVRKVKDGSFGVVWFSHDFYVFPRG
jgi:hypothetical protein